MTKFALKHIALHDVTVSICYVVYHILRS